MASTTRTSAATRHPRPRTDDIIRSPRSSDLHAARIRALVTPGQRLTTRTGTPSPAHGDVDDVDVRAAQRGGLGGGGYSRCVAAKGEGYGASSTFISSRESRRRW